jgi:mRNA interferase RelE/StbE
VAYTLEVNKRARRFIERLARAAPADYSKIERAIDVLLVNPRSPRATKLRGRGPLYRVRVGEYRIIYAIFDPDRLVTIEEIMRRTSTSYKDR